MGFICKCVSLQFLFFVSSLITSALKVHRGMGKTGAHEDIFETRVEHSCGGTFANSFWNGQSKCSCSTSRVLMTESHVSSGGNVKCFQSSEAGCRILFTQDPSGVAMLQTGKIEQQKEFYFHSSLYKIPDTIKFCPFGKLQYISATVWDVDNTEVNAKWRTDYSEALKRIFVISDSVLKILPNSEDFTGLLFKISLKCQHHRECALIRFYGNRQHPIGVAPFRSLRRHLAPRITVPLPTSTLTTKSHQSSQKIGNEENTKKQLSTGSIAVIAAGTGLCIGWISAGLMIFGYPYLKKRFPSMPKYY